MNLIKTSLLSFIATAVKLLSGLIINKAVSIFIGPSGLAVIGQFQNAQGIVRTLAQGGINSGVTKYTAEFHKNREKKHELWSSSLKITVFFSVIVSLLLLLFSSYWSHLIFGSTDYQYVFVVFSITMIMYSINQLLLSVINGLKEIRRFISINVIQSIYSLIFTTVLIVLFQLDGALIAMVTNQSVTFLILLWMLRGHREICFKNFILPISSEVCIKLSKYTLMTLVSTAAVPLSMMYIRNYLGENLSWDEAGYWQGMYYISTMYLMVITTALGTYYLPRLSEIKDRFELRKELLNGYKVILPILTILCFSIYLLKDFIVWLLFSEDFYPMLSLFKWQLVGDFLKISSWLLAYLMLAKAMTKVYVLTEIFFAITFVLFSIYFVSHHGLIGMSYAFATNYFCYLIAMVFIMNKYIFIKNSSISNN
ncbi:O-antigen translocase [Vibrio parahaemolyticus]|uniref:O-antigen translocase n=1 Tax=Vibrio parahaemolyticus TaxID=670 RepID=UPI0010376EC3|nr:O-antigen translocase [Vibrio parahaemolyticus]EJG1064232.1 O-antigen translocase [Vibrio parahaemolyticus O1]MDA0388941.1 O-antigen translocase [Vibrio parahaemolyticus]MDA0392855.1 O-antigen translocase [Vibrio parahaemolyticus]MDA0398043.1 O-antigen translocase [Vibrio parahaemolyticus]TBT05063.1 O-antigen translocase [Vibrio parahaemolyticus]